MSAFQNLPKEKQQRVILVGIVTLIACGVLFQFYVRKQISDISFCAQEVQRLKPQIEEAERTTKDIVRGNQQKDQIKALVDTQLAAMVSGDPFAWVVREISMLGEKHPVRIMSLRPGSLGQHTRYNRYGTYNTNIEVEGSYDQLGMFVEALENKFSTSEIRSVAITPTGSTRGEHRMIVFLSLVVLPEKEVAKTSKQGKSEAKGLS